MLDEEVVVARDIMTRDVAAVRPEASLLQAVKLMAARRISGLPVVDDAGTVVGMLTEGDLVRWHEGYSERQARWLDMLADGFQLAPDFLEAIQAERYKVQSVMSPGCVSVSEDTPARAIATLMHSKGIKRVAVLKEGKMVGIVARSDLIRAFAEKLEERAATPPSTPFETVNEALRRGREEVGLQASKRAHSGDLRSAKGR